MTSELAALAWGCVLALAHILAAGQAGTMQYGFKRNVGPRDEPVAPPTPIVGRLARAQANFIETFPVFIAAVMIVYLGDLESTTTELGAWLWLSARFVYLPVYAAGIPYLRSLLWVASLVGLVMLLAAPLLA